MVPMLAAGHLRSALLDSGCSVTLIAARAIPPGLPVLHGQDMRLETLEGRPIFTRGWLRLPSLLSDGFELGPLDA